MNSYVNRQKEEQSQGYVGYDYKEVISDSGRVSFLIDSYKNFGWEMDKNVTEDVMERLPGGASAYQKKVVLRLKRNRKILNKPELTRLQRNFEACMKEIEHLEKGKTSTAIAYSLAVGIAGTVFLAGAVFAVTATPPIIWLCVVLGIVGFAGWLLPYFIYKNEVQKREARFTELIEMKYDEIHEICEKGNKLLYHFL